MAGERSVYGTTKYEVGHAKEAEILVREFQATDSQLAEFFNVTPETIERWRQHHPEFNSSIEEVRKLQNAAVEKALFERAIGYKHQQEKVVTSKLTGEPIVASYNESFPPDINAAQFWLKNRDPENWKDVSKVEQNLNVAVVPVINISLKPKADEGK